MALKKTLPSSPLRSSKSSDQPATRKMLELVRKELSQKTDSGFTRMEGRFLDMKSRFTQIDARFEWMESQLSRMEFLLEEQNSNNRIVLEGLQALWQRQIVLESRLPEPSLPL